MEKPIILIEREMKEQLVHLLNQYVGQLPATMILASLSDVTRQFEDLAEKQYEQAKAVYEKESEVDANATRREES